MDKRHKTLLIVLVAITLISIGVAMRLLPHGPNMTPITAVALVAGAYLGYRYALIVPLASLFISDLFIGFYDWRLLLSIYASFAIIGLLGAWLRKYRAVQTYTVLAMAGSLFFFLSTNAAVWLFSPWYEKSLSGLLYAYELGLPFWRNMLIGDIFYTALLVGTCEVSLLLYYRARRHIALA